jgi:peptidoglycan/LPS O-acetylase OafA/YrhL
MKSELPPLKGGKPHIEILDFLRGIASIAVVFFHFANSNMPTILPNPLGPYFSYGKLGVQVFFVISGFVIPYAMYRSGYTLKNAGGFLLKRFVRIGPPSWAAILLVAGIYYGSIYLRGKPVEGMSWPGTEWHTILANMTYMYSFLDAKKYIDVYWTLEIEFEFYIVIALLLPLILKWASNPWLLSLLLGALSATFLIHDEYYLFFRDNSFFILGILLFLYKMKKIERNYFIYSSMAAMLICYGQQGLANSFAGIIAFLIIAFVQFAHPITTFLGKISYSLYITHFFSGAATEFFIKKITGDNLSDPAKVFMLFVYVGFAVLIAWLFYLAFEKPFISIAQKISKSVKNKVSPETAEVIKTQNW